VRIRLGKFNQPTIAETSVQWLLQAYYSCMQREGKNVFIFPISCNYERLFEVRNLADMMVSRDVDNMGLLAIQKKFNAFIGKKLGRAYVKFGKSISLRDYFSNYEQGGLAPAQINDAALNLTEKLVIENHLTSPVFLNNLVASLLLQHDQRTYPLQRLVTDCEKLYAYMQAREISTIMHTAPNKKNIERVLTGLGYKILSHPTDRSAHQVVDLKLRDNDHKELLSLHYYSTGLMQHMVMDVVIGKVLVTLAKTK